MTVKRALKLAAATLIVALATGKGPAMSQERLGVIPPEKMTEAQKKAATEFAEGRGYAVRGPFAAMIRSPEVMLSQSVSDVRVRGNLL